MCDICSAGRLKSSAVSALFSPVEYEVILDSDSPGPEPHPADANALMATANTATRSGLGNAARVFMAGSSFRRLRAFARERSYNWQAPGGRRADWRDRFARRLENRASSP